MIDRPATVQFVMWSYAVFAVANVALAFGWGSLTVALLFLAVLFFFYTRRNWARVLLMVWAVISIINGLLTAQINAGMFARAAAGVLLLFLLNRPDVRVWFTAAEPRRG